MKSLFDYASSMSLLAFFVVVMLLLQVISAVLHVLINRRLKSHHSKVWTSLSKPGFVTSNFETWRKSLHFAYSGHFLDLDDRSLSFLMFLKISVDIVSTVVLFCFFLIFLYAIAWAPNVVVREIGASGEDRYGKFYLLCCFSCIPVFLFLERKAFRRVQQVHPTEYARIEYLRPEIRQRESNSSDVGKIAATWWDYFSLFHGGKLFRLRDPILNIIILLMIFLEILCSMTALFLIINFVGR